MPEIMKLALCVTQEIQRCDFRANYLGRGPEAFAMKLQTRNARPGSY